MAQCKPKALHLDEVPPKDMKKKRKKRKGKKKQNLCFGKLEECSSGKGILDLKEAYKEKPVQEEIPARKGEEQPAEDTTEIQQEEASEDVQSEDDAWENKEESWSPEIEGVSDPRPDGTRLTYERDFLLQLQTNPICMQKPEGLPDLEIILVQARTPSKPGFQQNINACRMPKGDGGENMFLPAYIRQGSKQCLPSQPFLHSQRPVRIRGPPPPNNQPVDTCLPGAPVVQMIGYPGPTQFLAPRKPGPFIPQHVDFQLPMGGPPQYRPPQAMQGQSPLVSGPSQPNGPFVYQQSSGYPIGQPPPPVYIVRAPATPLQGMQQFQPQFEPRPRERKIFQIKDPISNKDVTQEILKRQPASSLTSTAVGTPNNTPNLSGQSSSSGIPPLTSQQQAEANVRAQFAAQVAATLVNSEDRPKKPEYTIQKSTVNNRADVDIVKAKETLNVQKEEGLKSARKNDTVSNVMETVQETQMKEGTVPVKSQTKEAVRGVKLCEGSSSESLLGSKSLVSSVDATTLRNKKISNVRVEIFTKELLYKGSRKSNAVKTDEEVNFSKVHVAPKDIKEERKKQRLKEMEKQSSEKAMDLIEAYTEKPVQGERKMASESLECSICCEKFDDQQHCPRLLPSCGHSFCTSCLQSLLKKNTINCPTCRSTVSAPAGLATLPKNFALLDILLSLPQKENDDLQLCQICDDEKHPAISCCLDCKEYMCKDAARLHTRQKMARDHCVVSLDELKANPKLAAASDVFCPEHNDQFRFFDEDCGHVVCRDCVTLRHHGHKCLSLADAASKYRREIDELSNKGIAVAEGIKAGDTFLKKATDDLKQEYANTAARIQSTFQELHEVLNARETVLMSELDNLYKTKDLTLTEQRDRLCFFQACLESGIQRAKTAVQSSSNVELLVSRSDIVSTLRALESQPPVFDPQTNSILDFSVDLNKLRDVLSEAGSVSDNSACAANTTASGQFGLTVIKSGEDVASFTLNTRDSKGRACALFGNVFEAKLKKGNEEKTVKLDLKENTPGTCTASYAIPADAKGKYSLFVLLRGDHIQGSPFTVYLGVPIGKLSCYNCSARLEGNMTYYYMDYDHMQPKNENVVDGYRASCYNGCQVQRHGKPFTFFPIFSFNPGEVVCGPC